MKESTEERLSILLDVINVVTTVMSIILTVVDIVLTSIAICHNRKDTKNKRSNRQAKR